MSPVATAVESDSFTESTAKHDPANGATIRNPALVVDGLQKMYGSGDAVRAVDDISL